MRKIEPTNLEQAKILIRHLPLKDFDGLRELIDVELTNQTQCGQRNNHV